MLDVKVRILLSVIAMVAMMLFVSCEEQISHNGKTPLISVDKQFLYKEDVEQHFAANRHLVDSVGFINDYVRHWLEDVLLYNMAQRNVSNSKEVERLVENYRRSLLLNIYQDRLIDQRLLPEIADEKIQEFYEQNKLLFLMKEPMLQGLYLKVTKKAPKLASVRKWLKSATTEDIENLEKYSLTNAIAYDYFVDTWRSLDNIAARMPMTAEALMRSLEKDTFVEVSDTGAFYFVNAVGILRKDDPMPLEMAAAEIRTLLTNSMKANFIKSVKSDLYNEALESNRIKIYDNRFMPMLEESITVED